MAYITEITVTLRCPTEYAEAVEARVIALVDSMEDVTDWRSDVDSPDYKAWADSEPTPQYGPGEFDEDKGPWHCKSCGNTQSFIGIDANGYGGEGSCDCDLDEDETCDCVTVLRQDVEIANGTPEPGMFYGPDESPETGSLHNNAHIGNYTSVECAQCGSVLWEDEESSEVPTNG